jgi:hypothetical protein
LHQAYSPEKYSLIQKIQQNIKPTSSEKITALEPSFIPAFKIAYGSNNITEASRLYDAFIQDQPQGMSFYALKQISAHIETYPFTDYTSTDHAQSGQNLDEELIAALKESSIKPPEPPNTMNSTSAAPSKLMPRGKTM